LLQMDGRELLRCLLRDHLDLRAVRERRVEQHDQQIVIDNSPRGAAPNCDLGVALVSAMVAVVRTDANGAPMGG
jgi:hypothetical protein